MLKVVVAAVSALWGHVEAVGVHILGWVGFSPMVARQLIRFGIVGVCAASAYIFTTALIVEVFGQSVSTSVVIAAAFAGTVSYLGNAFWSFETRPTVGNATRFVAVLSAGLLINVIIAEIGKKIGVGYFVINCTVLVLVPIFNFICHRLVTFARRFSPGATRRALASTEERLPSRKL